MKAGTLVIAVHPSELDVAERVRTHLMNRGHRNVFIGCHMKEPDCYKVFLKMNEIGVDTYCILPLAVSEGNNTVWNVPRHLTLPDNSGSWTMIGEHDVATRFSTAIGKSSRLAESIVRDLGEPSDDTGIIVAARGSALSFSEKTAEFYADAVRKAGWNAATGFLRHGPRTIAEALDELTRNGCTRFRIVPLLITVARTTFESLLSGLKAEIKIEKPVSEHPEFYDILESKVPEDW